MLFLKISNLRFFTGIILAHLTFSSITANSKCFLEKGHVDESQWNETALLKCHEMRTENICIVGGGLSGVHMGWLLKRRGSSFSSSPLHSFSSGFQNTVVFEKDLEPGGMIYTSEIEESDIPRELSAAFLSPDSDEMNALVSRFDLTLLPIPLEMISYRHSSQNLSIGDQIFSIVEWYEKTIPFITGENNLEMNSDLVLVALERYTILHKEIFGTYFTRLPPRPASYTQLQMLRGSFLEFLQRHDLLVLIPMMFQVYSVKVRVKFFGCMTVCVHGV
jgi:hypothetical protein